MLILICDIIKYFTIFYCTDWWFQSNWNNIAMFCFSPQKGWRIDMKENVTKSTKQIYLYLYTWNLGAVDFWDSALDMKNQRAKLHLALKLAPSGQSSFCCLTWGCFPSQFRLNVSPKDNWLFWSHLWELSISQLCLSSLLILVFRRLHGPTADGWSRCSDA